jgi:hypothetical protein
MGVAVARASPEYSNEWRFGESGELDEIADSPVLAGFNIPGADVVLTLKFKQTAHVRHRVPIR